MEKTGVDLWEDIETASFYMLTSVLYEIEHSYKDHLSFCKEDPKIDYFLLVKAETEFWSVQQEKFEELKEVFEKYTKEDYETYKKKLEEDSKKQEEHDEQKREKCEKKLEEEKKNNMKKQ